MYNFKIKSVIHDYTVDFINDYSESLKENTKDGDVLIIDKNINRLYSNQIEEILIQYRCIFIDATEDQKSYSGLIPIINELIEYGFKRNNRLIAIGGGITQDVTAV